MRDLGLVIHAEKWMLTPSQAVVFLGFIILSKIMTPSLTDEKKNKMKTILTDCLCKYKISIRKLARILKNIVASSPAVTYWPLHCRHLEREKITGLRYHKGNFDGKIWLSAKAKAEIPWWINNIDNSYHHINIPNRDIAMSTDASLTGWGIIDGIFPSRGLWHKAERFRAERIEMGLYTYCKSKALLHVWVICNNVTAISYVNNIPWNLKFAVILPTEYGIFLLQTSCGF